MCLEMFVLKPLHTTHALGDTSPLTHTVTFIPGAVYEAPHFMTVLKQILVMPKAHTYVHTSSQGIKLQIKKTVSSVSPL